MNERVLVAMSGGVDSSVAAALLSEQGYAVVGIAMRLTPDSAGSTPGGRRGACCSYEDFEDARRVAEKLGFPFYVIDLRREFADEVIDPFVGQYLTGRTPNPCVLCNRHIKFNRLWKRARALGAAFVATGHYARIERDGGGRFHLLRASDTAKDQSYFLFMLGQEELARTLFPLGTMSKAEVRDRARALGLKTADKPESQEICFVGAHGYASFVEQRGEPDKFRPGNFVDGSGRILGRHSGIHRFTVGQRRGLAISSPEPLFVRTIRPATGEVVVCTRAELSAAGLLAREVSLVDGRPEGGEPLAIEVKIRYRHPAVPATLGLIESGRAQLRFHRESPAVTPGQVCVFYRGDEVLGGGFIERAIES